ncbi:MAG: hypothetical protein ABIA04_04025, partial [Pseudomonadota bacterium]
YFPNLILAGETLGSSYPFSGNGTGRAMISGILAAKSIVEFEKNKKDIWLSKLYFKKINKRLKPPYHRVFYFFDYLFTETFLQKYIYKKVFKNNPNLIAYLSCKKLKVAELFSLKNIVKFIFNKKIF